MSFDRAITLSALKFLSGEDDNICRLCLGLAEERAVSIDDIVTLEKSYYEDTVSYHDIMESLGVSTDLCLPNKLCSACAEIILHTYLFEKLCEYSKQTWSDILQRFNVSLEEAGTLGSDIKAVYLVMTESNNITFTTRKTQRLSKKDVLHRIKNLQRKNNLIKSKKTSHNVKCAECDKQFASNIALSKHNAKVHHRTRNTCPQCSRIFTSPVQLEEHIARVHCPKTIKCPKCEKRFSTEKLLNLHDKYSHTAAICKLCCMQFPSKKVLRSHLDRHSIYKCPQCEKILSNKHTYKEHLKQCGNVHERKQKFFCDICGKGYVRKNGIRSHLKTDHGFGNVLTCKWCGKKFDAISKLKNHVVKHTKERNFFCEQCGNKFVTQAALIYHVRLHTGERPFPCDMCDENFLSASRRMEHKRRKHFGPTKECPMCPMKFITSNQLKKHVGRHYNPHSKLYCPAKNEAQDWAVNTIMIL